MGGACVLDVPSARRAQGECSGLRLQGVQTGAHVSGGTFGQVTASLSLAVFYSQPYTFISFPWGLIWTRLANDF